jgi:putative selenate reductase molybdopterin-binding subunit
VTLRRLTGQAAFAGDVTLPGLLHLALRRSPLAHALVTRIDAGAARALPGVVAVLTHEDAPRLLSPLLRYCGDRLVLAAAEEPELARRAAEAVEVALDRLPPALAADPEDEPRVAARVELAAGDVLAAFASAEHVVDGEWSVPFTPALSLEPPLAITWLDEDRRLVVRTSSESPFRVRGALAERLELPAARIRVVRPAIAGGSNGRDQLLVEDLCAAVTLATGRPARLSLTADEELTTTPGRPAQRTRVRLALRGGEIVGLELRAVVDVGAEAPGARELLRGALRHALGLYRFPALRVEAVAVRTNHPPACAPRGSDAAAALAVEGAVDEAAAALQEDAVRFRRRHLRGADEQQGLLLERLGEPALAGDARSLAPLLGANGRSGGPRRPRPLPGAGPVRSATGTGIARRSPGNLAGAAASLRLLDDGSFSLATGPSSLGGSDEVAYAEIASAVLGVPAQRVVCAAADTDSASFEPDDTSPSWLAAGPAVEQAARLALERIRAIGARLLGLAESDVSIERGAVVGANGGRASYAEIGAAALRSGEPLTVTAAPVEGAASPALACATAEVELDTETGVLRVKDLAATLAHAPVPGAPPLEGLVEGALAEAVEQALAAGLAFDDEGRPRVRQLRRWPLVTAIDLPRLRAVLLPADGPGRFAAASVGEAALRAALAAIVSAASQAAGTPLRSLPLRPERLLAPPPTEAP